MNSPPPLLVEQARQWEGQRSGVDRPGPARAFLQRFEAASLAAALAAEEATGRPPALGEVHPSEWLASRGYRVLETQAPARFGGLILRATIDLEAREALVYGEAVAQAEKALAQAGLSLPCPPAELFLAHEAFHLLAPHCPSRHAELAAHLFCTQVLGLAFFAGLLDTLG